MRFTTGRLMLRPIETSDREEMLAMLTDAAIARTYMIPEFESEAQAVRLFERFVELSRAEDRVVVGIDLGGLLIGWMNDVGIEGGCVELGYVIAPAFWGQGYMTEALGAAIYALFACGYDRVEAGAFEENKASIRVMEKCGMRRTEKKEIIEYRGALHACVYCAIGRGEKEENA